MKELINNHWAIEVSDGATDFGWRFENLTCKLPDSKPGRYHWFSQADDIMSQKGGDWQIVCESKSATEEQAAGMVNSSQWYFPVKHTRYIDYAYPYDREYKQRWSEGFGEALPSLNSLLTSKGCDLNKNWLILKKEK